jgi:hypothetical protein
VPFIDLDPDVFDSLGESWAPSWMPDLRAMEKWLAMADDRLDYTIEDLSGQKPWLRVAALTGALRPGFSYAWARNVEHAARAIGCTGHIEFTEIGEWKNHED